MGQGKRAAAAPDYRAILADGSVDAVVICSETDLHEELVLAAAAGRRACSWKNRWE